ncbi:MAG: LysR family transcriptional regulator [Bacteriovorax sp.]
MQNFNHLYYFYIVASLKSVTSAAKYLHTSQPSLSTQIKTLEMSLKKSLFTKNGKFLELTSEGAKIFEICSRMFAVYDELERYIKPPVAGREQINIGVNSEISRAFSTNVIGQVLKKYQVKNRPKIKLDSGSHESLIYRLKIRKLDFIITNSIVHEIDLKTLKSFSMPVVLAGTNDFFSKLKLSKLKKSEVILKKAAHYLALPTEQLKLRAETNAYLYKNKIKYDVLFESDIMNSIIRSAMDGISFCLVPLPYIQKEIQQGLLRIIPQSGGLWKHHLLIIGRNDLDNNMFIKKLIHELEANI